MCVHRQSMQSRIRLGPASIQFVSHVWYLLKTIHSLFSLSTIKPSDFFDVHRYNIYRRERASWSKTFSVIHRMRRKFMAQSEKRVEGTTKQEIYWIARVRRVRIVVKIFWDMIHNLWHPRNTIFPKNAPALSGGFTQSSNLRQNCSVCFDGSKRGGRRAHKIYFISLFEIELLFFYMKKVFFSGYFFYFWKAKSDVKEFVALWSELSEVLVNVSALK